MATEVLTVALPTLAVLIGILVSNSQLGDHRAHMDSRLSDLKADMDHRFEDLKATIDARFDVVSARFDQAHSELIRVEQVLDASLRHVERG